MPPEPSLSRRDRLPPRVLPLLYLGAAHLSLAAAFAVIAVDPAGVAGFFYHPRLILVVHLVTLGWITSSILGAVYLVGPMALGTPMPAEPSDWGSFALYLLGYSGVAFHFGIEELSGVGLSAVLVLLAVGRIGVKLLLGLSASRVPAAVQAHFALAFLNFAGAAFMGMLLAFNKLFSFLPGYVLANVFAHAHLAVLGWATMMVFAAGYRLLPMLLPAAMPQGKGVWTSAAVFEAGVVGLFVASLLQSPWRKAFAVLTVAGIGAFFVQVRWMTRNRRPPPKKLKRPDWGVLHAMTALGYLGLSAVLGLVLVFTETSSAPLVLVYGTCGLVGFLSQMIVGVSSRLLPIYSWLRASADSPPAFSPHDLPDRRLQAAAFLLWAAGVPALAAGLFLDRTGIVGLGGWLLLAAVAAGGASGVRALYST